MYRIKKSVDSQFLIRVIEEKVSPEEMEYFERWLEESEENKEQFSTLILLWDKTGASKTPETPDKEIMWRKIVSTLSKKTSPSLSLNSKRSSLHFNFEKDEPKEPDTLRNYHKSFDYIWLRLAAIVFFSAGLIYFINQYQPFHNSISNFEHKKELKEVIKEYTLRTEKGERITFPLGDGSVVYLNADSKLIYPSTFADSFRHVELIGEAYFSVKPYKNRPFEVISGDAKILVTGTKFNVKNRNDGISIVVAEGSVRTSTSVYEKVQTLRRGEMITYSQKNNNPKPVKADLSHYLAWRSDKLAFSHTPLVEVVEEIKRYYNLEAIFLKEKLKSKTLTGLFNTDSLDKIISIINLTLDIRIDRNGNKLIVTDGED